MKGLTVTFVILNARDKYIFLNNNNNEIINLIL